MPLTDYQKTVFKDLGYEPTPGQLLVHEDSHRERFVSGGERAGKTEVGEKELVLEIPKSKLIWLAGNEYADCRAEFERLADDLVKLGFLQSKPSFPKEGPCSLTTLNGCLVETKATKEFIKIGSYPPDFILLCEAARMEWEAYLRMTGRALQKRAKLVATGTLEGSLGWYPEYILQGLSGADPYMKSFILPTWSNHHIFKPFRVISETEAEGDPELLRLFHKMPYELFMERFAATPCPPSGLIMREFSNTIHVGDYAYDPDIPVEIAVDPGYGGAYAVLAIQIKESIPYIVDEIYLQGYVTEDIIVEMQKKPWGNRVMGGVIDVAGKQHQAMAAPIEVWQEKTGLYLDSKFVQVEGGINLVRTFLKVSPVTKRPQMYINNSCHGIIAECGGGKSPVQGGGAWIRDKNGKIIDKNNHSLKAFAYYAVNRFGYSTGDGYGSDYGKVFDLNKRNDSGSKVGWQNVLTSTR